MGSLVSVLIAAYNHEKYIQGTINSIINQTYQNIELILIDDGSPDKTWEKVLELEDVCNKRFRRVVFLTQKNHGVCSTMNRLLEHAKGDYIFGIASDDMAAPDAIEMFHDFLLKNADYGLVVGENELIDAEGIPCYWDKKKNVVHDPNRAKYISFTDFLIKKNLKVNFTSDDFGSYTSLLFGNYIPNGYLVRRKMYDLAGSFTNEAPMEDYWLMLQISKHAKMKYIPKTAFYYRWHGENAIKQLDKMQQYTALTLRYEIEVVKKMNDPNLEKILIEALNQCDVKRILRIPYVFEIHKLRSIREKKTLLKILWMKFEIRKVRLKDI